MSITAPLVPADDGPPDPTAPPRTSGRAGIGWLYALPTALFVVLLFLVPLLLVFQMSASDWPLLGGNQGCNFPENFASAVDNRFFVDSVLFTLKYTVLATDPAHRPRPRPRPARAGVEPVEGLPAHRRSSSRARSASHPRPCSSTCSTRRSPARSPSSPRHGASPSSAPRMPRSGRRSSSSSGATPASTCCSCSSACRASPTRSTRPPASTAPRAGRPSAT